MLPFIFALVVLFNPIMGGKYTITDEAWFDVEVKDMDGPGQDFRGRFVVGLFGETAPMTVMNYVAITRGYKRGREVLHYKNTPIHRIVPDFVIQMGDITVGDGTGGKSIFGERFNDEEFALSHRSPGWVAMANHGKDTNGSQFYILLTKARWLDKKHVVFGKVIRGMDVVKTLGEVRADPNTAVPRKRVKIIDCGLNDLPKKYDLSEDDLDSEKDL
ncbi:DgyrCDS516 [Dimorphilus gyrociliatus]|uniref:Peptidyl-prolyl cis-trans isomerase n=1 Tax=Dimorphilus gyrociliatus TaxID=2664684 RepID=A0A7I8V7D0_9ANNE|nr:DgyrCDS516 [Dimorphilus gyrociliatus]